MSGRSDERHSESAFSFNPLTARRYGYQETTEGDQHQRQASPSLGSSGTALFDAMEPTLNNTFSDESHSQPNLLQLLESWKQRIRDLWFRRNGISAPLTESRYDYLISELHSADNAQSHFREILARGPATQTTLKVISVDGLPIASYSSTFAPLDVTFSQGGAIESGPHNAVSSSIVAQGSPASSESEHSYVPTTPPMYSEVIRRPAISISGKIEPAAEVLAVTTSEDGDPQALTLLRNKSPASDWGDTYRGIIRVQRPAGVKWNEPIRCTYLSPITGEQCRTRVKRGPDLERHLRTVHVRQEAQAVSDGLIPRSSAKLLPSEWHVGDRLDFDCPYCSIRFTRDDARNRHVKMKH